MDVPTDVQSEMVAIDALPAPETADPPTRFRAHDEPKASLSRRKVEPGF